mgnify:CR=1 FL=1
MTKISLEIDGRVLSMDDATAEELIKDSLREAAQDYKEDIELGARNENMCNV